MSSSNNKGLAVVTGGSSGIGLATVKALLVDGYKVLVLARNKQNLQKLELGENCVCKAVDVSNNVELSRAIAEGEAHFGAVEVLVNNAGCMYLAKIEDHPQEEVDKMLNTNILGVVNCIRAVLPKMKARGSGTIINVSSIAGLKTFPNHGIYCATKYAIQGLTETVREEIHGTNVRCITICPGVTSTDLLTTNRSGPVLDDYRQWVKDMGEPLKSEDVTSCIMFALSMPQSVCVREIVIAPTKQAA